MTVIDQPAPTPSAIAGIAHATWAGSAQGLSTLNVWRQSVAPGGATPPHRHDCEELVLCLGGRGELHIGGAVHPFGAGQTLVIPRNAPHLVRNAGAEPMETLAILAMAPVEVRLLDGERLALPWAS